MTFNWINEEILVIEYCLIVGPFLDENAFICLSIFRSLIVITHQNCSNIKCGMNGKCISTAVGPICNCTDGVTGLHCQTRAYMISIFVIGITCIY